MPGRSGMCKREEISAENTRAGVFNLEVGFVQTGLWGGTDQVLDVLSATRKSAQVASYEIGSGSRVCESSIG